MTPLGRSSRVLFLSLLFGCSPGEPARRTGDSPREVDHGTPGDQTVQDTSRAKFHPGVPISWADFVLDLGGGVKMGFVRIKAGKFMMGSDEPYHESEQPMHEVTISRDFWIGETPATQAQWKAVMGTNPSHFQGDDFPVDSVSWEDCRTFLIKLAENTGDQLRGRKAGLPTEAEWEYACRAGTTSKWSFGDDESALKDYSWYDKNSKNTTHSVGLKRPNAWGLYDMYGNVWQWCEDWFAPYSRGPQIDPTGPSSGQDRCQRGGCWQSPGARSAFRGSDNPTDREHTVGLRPVFR